VTVGDPNPAGKVAAFFDVDGTLLDTTIVHYYLYFRRRLMSGISFKLWYVAFLVKCLYYLVLDKIDRQRFNVVFYRNYAGLGVDDVKAMIADCHRDLVIPRRFEQAAACVREHQRAGHMTVLVTGSIDFLMLPIAADLGVDEVIAVSLVEANELFTGELTGPPIGMEEKARRMKQFAEANGIDLERSHAYGDSTADLPMLETVGLPHTVNPDRSLAATAQERGWPVHRWTVPARDDRR
jgi:fatty acyl-CoA reductase